MSFSSVRPPPQQGAPNRLLTRVYSYNLRPVVLLVTFLAALWSLFGAISYFRSVGIDNDRGFPHLATMSIVLGALYAGVCAIEIYGCLAAYTQRLALVCIYAFASVGTALITVALGIIRVVVHFSLKDDILDLCENLSAGSKFSVYPYGFWGPVYRDSLSASEAEDWCKRSWDHDSWADIIGMLITIFLAVLFTGVSFSYYRQVQDPSSVLNRTRAPMNNYNQSASHYAPAYDAAMPHLGYNYGGGPGGQGGGYQPGYQQQPYFAPPPGPPPHFAQPRDSGDFSKPPGYSGDDEAVGKAGGYGYGDKKDEAEDPFADFESTKARK